MEKMRFKTNRLSGRQLCIFIQKLWIAEILLGGLHRLTEEPLEMITCPLETNNGQYLIQLHLLFWRQFDQLQLYRTVNIIFWCRCVVITRNYRYRQPCTCEVKYLKCVLDGIRKVLERTDRNRLLRRVLRRWVRFGQVWDDYLNVALRAEGARLEKGLAVVHAPPVHVHPWNDTKR